MSGIRVETLNRGYAELEELRVVFDRVDPYPELVDKVVGLMKKHSFHNTHAHAGPEDEFKMVFARATSFGIEQLERMAAKSRAEIRAAAKRRVNSNVKLRPAPRVILTTLVDAPHGMRASKLFHKVIHDWSIPPCDAVAALSWLRDHRFVASKTCDNTIELTWAITSKGRIALRSFSI